VQDIKLLRDIKESKGQFAAIVLVIAVGAFFYAGLITISNDLSQYTKVYFKEHNLSDLTVYYSKVSQSEIYLFVSNSTYKYKTIVAHILHYVYYRLYRTIFKMRGRI
jgi:hypothetical protein